MTIERIKEDKKQLFNETYKDSDKDLYLQCAYNLLKMTPTQRLKLYKSGRGGYRS